MKHQHHEILNLIGYGLAKFDKKLLNYFNCKTKVAFFEYLVNLKVADNTTVIRNRQDLFDPYFENGRRGWVAGSERYIHRKILIDSLFGDLNVLEYSEMLKSYLKQDFNATELSTKISPLTSTKFKKLQETGLSAELFFIHNYQNLPNFKDKNYQLEDARLFGDGYDFQLTNDDSQILIEVKGIQATKGSFRLTQREFETANFYKNNYGIAIVSNLSHVPKINMIFNPLEQNYLELKKQELTYTQIYYTSNSLNFEK